MGDRTPAEISRATGKTPGAVTQWLDGTIRSLKADTAARLEAATGYRATWLVTGKGPKKIGNTEPGPDVLGGVPLISWIQAGAWNEASDPLLPGEAERWMPCIAPHSESTYALRVRGDSMVSPHGRTYPEGCIIFVDPMRVDPHNGDRIVAKLIDSEEVTFKVYKEEDGRRWLQPLNTAHLPIHDQFKVLGTVIGKWEDG